MDTTKVIAWVVGVLVVCAILIWLWVEIEAHKTRRAEATARRLIDEHNARVKTNREAIRRELARLGSTDRPNTVPQLERRKVKAPSVPSNNQ